MARRRREPPTPSRITTAAVTITADDWLDPLAGLHDFPSWEPEAMVEHARQHAPHLLVSPEQAQANAERRAAIEQRCRERASR